MHFVLKLEKKKQQQQQSIHSFWTTNQSFRFYLNNDSHFFVFILDISLPADSGINLTVKRKLAVVLYLEKDGFYA